MSVQRSDKKQYWFASKRYGWGWGLPSVWQGWVTLLIYVGLLAVVAFIFPPEENLSLFLSSTVLLSLILIGVCWIKGEPPRWRWGKDKNA